jgi:hypothetical protein
LQCPDKDELAAVMKLLEEHRGDFWPDFIAVTLMTGKAGCVGATGTGIWPRRRRCSRGKRAKSTPSPPDPDPLAPVIEHVAA